VVANHCFVDFDAPPYLNLEKHGIITPPCILELCRPFF
jgi:hypothetical protein